LAVKERDSDMVHVSDLAWLAAVCLLKIPLLEPEVIVSIYPSISFRKAVYWFVDAGYRCAMDGSEHHCCQLLGRQCMAKATSLNWNMLPSLEGSSK
jgi:hypothetical protein